MEKRLLCLLVVAVSSSWALQERGVRKSYIASLLAQARSLEELPCDGSDVPDWVCSNKGWNPACGTPQLDQMEIPDGTSSPFSDEPKPGNSGAGIRKEGGADTDVALKIAGRSIPWDKLKKDEAGATLYKNHDWKKLEGQGATMTELWTGKGEKGTLKARTADALNTMNGFFFDLRSPDFYTENVVSIHKEIFQTQITYKICGYIEKNLRIVSTFEKHDQDLSWQEEIVQSIFAKREAGEQNYYLVGYNFDSEHGPQGGTTLPQGASGKVSNVYYSLLSRDVGNIFPDMCICDWKDAESQKKWLTAGTDYDSLAPFIEDCKTKQGKPKQKGGGYCHSRDEDPKAEEMGDGIWDKDGAGNDISTF